MADKSLTSSKPDNFPPHPQLRLPHQANDKLMKKGERAVVAHELKSEAPKPRNKFTKAIPTAPGAGNNPSGDSTRSPSMTELDVVAEAAAAIKMVTFAPTPPMVSESLLSGSSRTVAQPYDSANRLPLKSRPPLPPKAADDLRQIQTILKPRHHHSAMRARLGAKAFEEAILKKMAESREYLLSMLQGDCHCFPVTDDTIGVMETGSLENVRSSILSFMGNKEVLDFRSMEESKSRSTSSFVSNSDFDEPAADPSLFTPPNEFNWFCRDNMGLVFSSAAACHLFTTLKSTPGPSSLFEFYLNGNRADSSDAQDEDLIQFTSIAETLSDMTQLTKLVLRGICDDTIMKCIGQSLPHLEYLDVSGSQSVTDVGIQNLVFKNPVLNSAFYLIPTWVGKNGDKMNPLIQKLSYLDHSWTSVSSMGRKIVQLLPGSYLFKRLMYIADQDPVGHHVFIREKPCLQCPLPSTSNKSLNPNEFTKALGEYIGLKGIKHFLNIVANHPWKTCHLTLYPTRPLSIGPWSGVGGGIGMETDSESIEEVKSRTSLRSSTKAYFGILTPNQNEKRVQGIVHWDGAGNLTQLYTIYPMNLNALGNATNIQLFRGILYDTWRMQYSILPELVELNIFTEPSTLINILQFCRNLKLVHVRIRTKALTDTEFIKAIQNTMSRTSLEDLWIAPGSHRETILKSTSQIPSSSTLNKGEESSQSQSQTSVSAPISITSVEDLKRSLSASDFITGELVQLSMESVNAVLKACPKLKRLGDVATWINVEEDNFNHFCEDLKKRNKRVTVLWGNMNFPMSCGTIRK